MCIYVYMYICIHVYMYICIHVYLCICTYAHMCTCIHVYMYTYTYAYMHTCTHVLIYICVHIHMHMYKNAYMYIYMYTCTHVYISLPLTVVTHLRRLRHHARRVRRRAHAARKELLKLRKVLGQGKRRALKSVRHTPRALEPRRRSGIWRPERSGGAQGLYLSLCEARRQLRQRDFPAVGRGLRRRWPRALLLLLLLLLLNRRRRRGCRGAPELPQPETARCRAEQHTAGGAADLCRLCGRIARHAAAQRKRRLHPCPRRGSAARVALGRRRGCGDGSNGAGGTTRKAGHLWRRTAQQGCSHQRPRPRTRWPPLGRRGRAAGPAPVWRWPRGAQPGQGEDGQLARRHRVQCIPA